MAVSFKLHNTDFPPLPSPSASTYKPFPHNINIRSFKSFAIATKITR